MPTDDLGPAPEFRCITSERSRSFLMQLREAVAPILANNLLHHFTDHSVTHSDQVVRLVGDLIELAQETNACLLDDELVVVYAACYLHDIGMQLENAGQTSVVQGLELGTPWDELSEATRRDLLRQHHHRISAEMVHRSARSGTPPVGIQIGEDYHPSAIACLCEAHNIDSRGDRYAELTQTQSDLRMPLLCGVLRVADILEESRRRAKPEKARTLNLDIESWTHWWRHYYTDNVTFDRDGMVITVCFDFPPSRLQEYEKVVPELQFPQIYNELARHRSEFNKHGLAWVLVKRVKSKEHSTTKEMPEQVLTEMLKQLNKLHRLEDEQRQRLRLDQFREARPQINRRVDELKQQADSLPPADYLLQLSKLAFDMYELGGKRSATVMLQSAFAQAWQHLDRVNRLRLGTRLLAMLIEHEMPELGRSWVQQLTEEAISHDSGDLKRESLTAIGDWYVAAGGYDQGVEVFERAMQTTTGQDKDQLRVKLKELHFLQGELTRVADTGTDRQDSDA